MLLDAFLKFEGNAAIAGESTDSLHTNEIEVISFGHSLGAVPLQQGNQLTTEVIPLVVIKLLDKTTPALCKAAASRTQIGSATLSLCQRPAGATTDAKLDVFTIKMEPVYVSRVTMLGAHMPWPLSYQSDLLRCALPLYTSTELIGAGPYEQIELVFTKVTWTYKGNAGTGNTQAVYDMSQLNLQ